MGAVCLTLRGDAEGDSLVADAGSVRDPEPIYEVGHQYEPRARKRRVHTLALRRFPRLKSRMLPSLSSEGGGEDALALFGDRLDAEESGP